MTNLADIHPSNTQSPTGPAPVSSDDEINLMGCWLLIWKRRWLIGGLSGAAVLMTMVYSFQLPKIYESSATLLPSLGGGESGGIGNLLGAAGGGGGGGGGGGAAIQTFGIALPSTSATQSDVLQAMLKSRIMADEVIKQFDLQTIYRAKTMQNARKTLEGCTKITVTKEKVIKITVEAESPQLAADIANFYVTNLDHLNQTLNITKAGQTRVFLERRLAETKVNLVREEEELKEFQMKNKTIAMEPQAQAMLAAAVGVQAQIMAQEVKLQVMNSYLSPDNPELAHERSLLQELRKQLSLLESGRGGQGMLPGDRLHPAMITVPSLALDYLRAMRELKVQEALYTMLTSQYEQVKLAEARDTPTVQVLDTAIPAEMKSKPNIRQNMLVAGVASFFVGIFLAFVLHYLERVRN